MNKKSVLATSLIAIAIVVGWFFLKENSTRSQVFTNPTATTSTAGSQSNWEVYKNTAYRYSIEYPQTWHVWQVLEEEKEIVEKSRMVEISSNIPGEKGYVGITTWDPSKFNGTDSASIAFRQSMTVDLPSFAEVMRQKEISDRSHSLPGKKVGDLRQTVFAGQKAFSYIVTGSYDKYGGTSATYVFLENKGIKYMVYYSLNDGLPQEIADTFKFTN